MTTRKRCRWWLAPLLAWALLPAAVPAALVQTGNVEPDVNAWTSTTTVYIGRTSNGSVTVDTGSLLASHISNLGYNSGSTGTVTVAGVDSTWTISRRTSGITTFHDFLNVGYSGNGVLTIEAGGQVSNTFGRLGYNSGSTGTATVTGAGSKWINKDRLTVGSSGAGTLTIEAGGEVSNTYATLGENSGSMGTATVTGAGSKWINSDSLAIARGTLAVEAGGEVSSRDGSLGSSSGSTGMVTVTGAGSKWINSGSLAVTRGTLAVEAGGEVSSRDGSLGSSSGSTGMVTVTGAESKWTNSSSLIVGSSGNGTLTVEAGGLVSSTSGSIGSQAGSTGAATVTGAGSKWTSSSSLTVGYLGNGTLTIEAGGEVSNTSGNLGYLSGSTGTVTVTGAGSKWTNSGVLVVGRDGVGTLTIEAGGEVSNTSGTIGSSSTSAVTVTGAGSKWTNSGSLTVGYLGVGTLTIKAGGEVSNTSGTIGSSSTSAVTVTGAGSKWTNTGALTVNRGTLTVSDAGEVVAGSLRASLSDLHGDGTITATAGAVLDADFVFDAAHGTSQSFAFGSGGTLNVTVSGGDLGAGYKESGSLTISEGVGISSTNGYLGYSSGSTGTATVTGVGSKWTNSGTLYVGRNSGGSGTLTVSDGGEVEAGTLHASLSDLHGDGTITATAGAVLDADFVFDAAHGISQSFAFGSGGTLNVTVSGGVLGVGYKQSGSLTISEGVNISSSLGILGNNSGSTGIATVTGVGSKWTNSGGLTVGNLGVGTLVIEAGGEVASQGGSLGTQIGSTGMVTVTGVGSKWTNSGSLAITRGTLAIEAGGQVSNTSGSLGNSSGMVTVTGADSKWTNSVNLAITRGTLAIEAGGLVSARGTLTIGNTLSFINMATGGMLALYGDADDSLSQFLGLISGNGAALRFWDNSLSDWAPLASGTLGVDYTLEYLAAGDLAGFTLLTVGEASSPGLAGDFNGDGVVDGGDFLVWQRDPGVGSLSDWKANFGQPLAAPAGAPVPEPTAAVLALLIPLVLSWSRRFRASHVSL